MTSQDLLDKDFKAWRSFAVGSKKELMASLPNSFGVYVIRCQTEFARVCGRSDILYIGSATNQRGLKGRINQFFSPGPTQSTNKRIRARIERADIYELCWLKTETISHARALEQDLLEQYLRDHEELPPENLRR